jgi:hypothetical protein
VVVAKSIGGDTSSSNSAYIDQTNKQAIVQVPIAVQRASAEYNAFVIHH